MKEGLSISKQTVEKQRLEIAGLREQIKNWNRTQLNARGGGDGEQMRQLQLTIEVRKLSLPRL